MSNKGYIKQIFENYISNFQKGNGDNLREEDEERSKLLSPELVMNQKMKLDTESPALARASTGWYNRMMTQVE